jgi:hypothetical protein
MALSESGMGGKAPISIGGIKTVKPAKSGKKAKKSLYVKPKGKKGGKKK